MSELQLDSTLVATLAALETHRVEFVLVGDVANAIYDHGGIVCAVAIVPGSYARNVERLAHALRTLNAELGIAGRPDPRGLDWRRMDLRELAPCTFMTAYADIDVDFEPAGTAGFRDLFQDADRFPVAPGVRPYVASLDDLDRVGRAGSGPRPAPPLPVTPPLVAPTLAAYAEHARDAERPSDPERARYAQPESYLERDRFAEHPPDAEPESYTARDRFAEHPPGAERPSGADGATDAERPPAVRPPDEDDYDPGIWTEEEFRAIRAGRITF